jgi:hypothetical protein
MYLLIDTKTFDELQRDIYIFFLSLCLGQREDVEILSKKEVIFSTEFRRELLS